MPFRTKCKCGTLLLDTEKFTGRCRCCVINAACSVVVGADNIWSLLAEYNALIEFAYPKSSKFEVETSLAVLDRMIALSNELLIMFRIGGFNYTWVLPEDYEIAFNLGIPYREISNKIVAFESRIKRSIECPVCIAYCYELVDSDDELLCELHERALFGALEANVCRDLCPLIIEYTYYNGRHAAIHYLLSDSPQDKMLIATSKMKRRIKAAMNRSKCEEARESPKNNNRRETNEIEQIPMSSRFGKYASVRIVA